MYIHSSGRVNNICDFVKWLLPKNCYFGEQTLIKVKKKKIQTDKKVNKFHLSNKFEERLCKTMSKLKLSNKYLVSKNSVSNSL